MSAVTVIDGRILLGRAPTGEESPVLTVELAPKWYNLWLMQSNGRLHRVPYPDAGGYFGPSYRDHVPNPYYVEQLAAHNGWALNSLAHEMMIGRWMSEAMDRDYESYLVDDTEYHHDRR